VTSKLISVTTLDGRYEVTIDADPVVHGDEVYAGCQTCDRCGIVTATRQMRFDESVGELLCAGCAREGRQ